LSSDNNDIGKKFLAFAGVFTLVFGGSIGGAFWAGIDKYNQIDSNKKAIEHNKDAIDEKLSTKSFKKYQLEQKIEDANAKLAYYESLDALTLREQADVKYLTDSIGRWQSQRQELDDEE